jgi:hypothetical protein
VAEEPVAAAIDPTARFALRAARWCDETLVVPTTVLDDHADGVAVAAYARLDRLLSHAGVGDCVLVLGRPPAGGGMPGDPDDPGDPAAAGVLATLVDGWLQVAHPSTWGRRAA